MGSQAGVVDINHAFHLDYKCCMWIEFQSISTWLRGFSLGTPVSSLLKIDSPSDPSGCGAVLWIRSHIWIVFRGRAPNWQYTSYGPISLSYSKLLAALKTWAFNSTRPTLSLLDVNIVFFKLLAWHRATCSSYFTSGFLNDNYNVPTLPSKFRDLTLFLMRLLNLFQAWFAACALEFALQSSQRSFSESPHYSCCIKISKSIGFISRMRYIVKNWIFG